MCQCLTFVHTATDFLLLLVGGLSGGRGLDSLQESGGLATLPKHLPGMVRYSARGRPVQRRSHGSLRVRHLTLCLRGHEGGRREERVTRGKEKECQRCKWRRETREVTKVTRKKIDDERSDRKTLLRCAFGLGCTVDLTRVGHMLIGSVFSVLGMILFSFLYSLWAHSWHTTYQFLCCI